MSGKSKIQYQYAYSSSDEIIHVESLTNTPEVRRETFKCISCGNLLIPKLGKIKRKHFAHKHVCDCSGETYLHRLAKELFLREYRYCLEQRLPFNIEVQISKYCDLHQADFGLTCRLGTEVKTYDLTKRYKRIELETPVGEFIPDILLSDIAGEKQLFIEIAVTHKLTHRKSQSGFQIVEIDVESEEDLDFIRDQLLKESKKTRFIGLNTSPVKAKCLGTQSCPEEVGVFRVFGNGKSIYTNENLPSTHNLISSRERRQITHYKVFNPPEWWDLEKHMSMVIETYEKGVKIKNCYLCRYQGDNYAYSDRGNPIFCKFLKIKCNSNQAAVCKYFRI